MHICGDRVLLSGIEKVQLDNDNSHSDFKVIVIYHQPVMECALDVLTNLMKHKTIVLKARGDSIPTAVAVANVITENMLKGHSEIPDIIVGSEDFDGRYGTTLISTIKITLTKTN